MKIFLSVLLFWMTFPAHAALNIFACTPEWGALASALGGDAARVYTATTALQDPHRIEARPSLIARARSADLVICTGAELEAGWLPLVLSQSGNARIQVGRPGYLEAASVVALVDPPARLDRSMGDIHPAGNPHLHLDPRNIASVAAALGERMAQLDDSDADGYRERTRSFLTRWREASARWEAQAAPLRGLPLVVYHRSFTYLFGWLGMREVAALEPKPGLPPSAAHLAGLVQRLAVEPAKAVIRAPYNDPRPAEWLAQRARVPAIVLPYTVGGAEKTDSLFGLYEQTLARLLEIAR